MVPLFDFNTNLIPINYNNPNLILKPGITGLPQLKFSDIKLDSIRKFENYYAINYSIAFDIEIILKSIIKI